MSDPVEAWFCRVCGIEAPDFLPAKPRRRIGVTALPCGHVQPLDARGVGGLDYGIPPSVRTVPTPA